jgi:hypothetical protein
MDNNNTASKGYSPTENSSMKIVDALQHLSY